MGNPRSELKDRLMPASTMAEANISRPTVTTSISTLQDEKELWQLFREGNEAAFVHLYNIYYDKLYHFGLQITQDRELVKDAIQDFFIDLRKGRARLAQVQSVKVYLFVAFRRKLVKYLQKEQKNCRHAQEVFDQAFNFQLSTEDKMINAQLEQEHLQALSRSMNQLSPREKEAIYCYFFQNLSYREIGEMFSYTDVKTARNLIYGALNKLKNLLLALFLILLLP
jgi:RNA polymerase sigma-70 factor (ECF subfamily)